MSVGFEIFNHERLSFNVIRSYLNFFPFLRNINMLYFEKLYFLLCIRISETYITI